jgi:hypothetical protein
MGSEVVTGAVGSRIMGMQTHRMADISYLQVRQSSKAV